MKSKPRGRPALRDGEASTPVSLRMAATDYDDTCQRARRAGITLAEQVRRDIRAATEKSNQK